MNKDAELNPVRLVFF